MEKILAVLFFILFLSSSHFTYSQTLILTAGTVCTDSIVSVPVRIQNAQSIYGFKLRLQYNKTLMVYNSYTILNPLLSGTTITDISSTGQISLEFQDTTGISIQDDEIFLLHFTMTSINSTLLVWDTVYFWQIGGAPANAQHIYGALVLPPLITLQPANALVCEGTGNIALYNMQAVGTMHTYQWQVSVNNGISWTDLTNNSLYNGVNMPKLLVSSPSANMHQYLYRCKLSGYCTLYSDEVSLIILSNIASHPHDTTVNTGGTAIFRAEGSGINPDYLWEISTDGGFTWSSNSLFPPITTPEITIAGVPQSWNGYKFRCNISGNCSPPATPSHVATLFVGTSSIYNDEDLKHSIYPNPFNEYCTITNPYFPYSNYAFYLYSINGKLIMEELNISVEHHIFYKKNLKPGLYFYRIMSENKIETTGKLIILP